MSEDLEKGLQDLIAMAAGKAVASPVPVRFYVEPMEDTDEFAKSGRRIFRDVEMIEKRIGKDIIQRPVSEADKREYAAQYVAFRRGQSQEAVEGMPLRQWAACTRSEAETLSVAGIRTVEHLAGAPDSHIQQLGPYLALKQKAKDWIEQAKSGAELSRLRDGDNELEGRVGALESMLSKATEEIKAARNNGGALPAGPDPQIAEMKAAIAQLLAAQAPAAPKRRGRPPKNGTPTTES